MKVLLVGNGGREHALAWKLASSPLVSALFCAPGNPGTAEYADNVPIAATDLVGIEKFVRNNGIAFPRWASKCLARRKKPPGSKATNGSPRK
jgi:phosphoribosylamine--glycine ligase